MEALEQVVYLWWLLQVMQFALIGAWCIRHD
jgi:hypothetical protein